MHPLKRLTYADQSYYVHLADVSLAEKHTKHTPVKSDDLPIQKIFRKVAHRDMNEEELRAFHLTAKKKHKHKHKIKNA